MALALPEVVDDLARRFEHHALDLAPGFDDVALVVDHCQARAPAVAGMDGDAFVCDALHDGVLPGLLIPMALGMGAMLYAQPPVWLMGALVALYMAVCGYNLSQMERR